jgi:hypothetical protein
MATTIHETLASAHPLLSLLGGRVHCVPADSLSFDSRAARARVTCTGERNLKKQLLLSRRHHKRVETPQGVWVFWRCGRTEDTSQVKDLSVGGLFIETSKVCPVDATVELHFLVEDGGIKANATVRYVKAGSGLGLQFKTVRSEDQARFAVMIKRLFQPEERANATTEIFSKQRDR